MFVQAYVECIVQVIFKFNPRTAIGDHAREIKILAVGGDLFLFVFFEDDTRGSVQLAYDDALSAIDDEGGVIRHERNVTDINVLFGDLFDLTTFFAVKYPEGGLQGC